MDAACDPEVETVVYMFASQTGKTSLEENILGYHVEQDPAPILFIMPILDLAQAFSKDRLAPLVRDTEALADKISEARSRDGDNTLLHKKFPGGHITLAGANSPSSLASRPIRILICDEVDRYPPSAGTEGDPVGLATKRTQTFWNRKHILSSTPGTKGLSRIEQAYEESDQRRYYVPCPHCDHDQVLTWKQVRWEPDQPEGAVYVCEECGCAWSDVERWRAVTKGEWRAHAPFNGTAGFHLNAFYSPWVKLADVVTDFLKAKSHPERLKVWTNTVLAETWEEKADKVDPHALEARTEDWGDLAPRGVLVVSCGVDVQDDRVEIERVGWGVEEESWSLDHRIIYGDPSAPALWKDLDAYLHETTPTEDGRELPVAATAVDTGGHYTLAAYKFCGPRFRRRVYAIKGAAGAGRPVWPKRASKNNKGRINLFIVGVDAAKDMVLSRLRTTQHGPGYSHFPKGRDAEYFKQLTAEKVVTRYVKGFPVRTYIKDEATRNEALDCRVYAYAALVALNVNWGRLLANTHGEIYVPPQRRREEAETEDDAAAAEIDQQDDPTPKKQSKQARRRRSTRSSFMTR